MAAKNELIINCGISHVSASVFSYDGNMLNLNKVGLHTLTHDYTQDSLWLDSVIAGIKTLCLELKLKGNARFIFPGSFLLTKTIRVPKVEKDKQDKIVGFELSQKMPFPLAELIWDYQIIDDDGVEQEILAFAVKPEVAETFCERVVQLGLTPTQLTPAPVLDYNAMRASGIGLNDSETLVVNMGAKSTNLLFINPTGFLIRSIAVGGNALSQNLADRLGVLFGKAEELKKSYFAGHMTFSPDDPNLQNIESCAQQFLARASQEITRSIVTYKRLKKGKSPERIFLAGRGALLRHLPEYISQSQQLSIDYFDPTKIIQIGPEVSVEMQSLLPFMLSEPVGLASTIYMDVGDNKFAPPLNLLPSSKLSSLSFKKKKPFLCMACCVFALLPLPGLLRSKSNLQSLQENLADQKVITRKISQDLSKQKGLKRKFEFIDRLASEVTNKNKPFIEKQNTCWQIHSFLNELQDTLEHSEISDTWFDNLEIIIQEKNQNLRGNTFKDNNKVSIKIELSGRYLVRATDEELSGGGSEKRNALIDLNSQKQAALTTYIQSIPIVGKIDQKVFSIEGKGDLFGKYFTHFEYQVSTKL
ncbi:MAG: pilus assembly protein PilM [Opitutales bacterium]|nr:pilus assembly protein PilM [Opitutales bacterium]